MIQIEVQRMGSLTVGVVAGFVLGYGKALHDAPEIRELLTEILAELKRQGGPSPHEKPLRIQPHPDDIDGDAVEETPQGETVS